MDEEVINFTINGIKHTVPHNVHPATRLVDYIRGTAQLKGTKVMCREGGCGACVVTVQCTDHVTNTEQTRAINSCLCPISIARGWKITTTEGLGGKQNGFHPIQERLADYSATQCGFCTPGFVMSIYGMLKEKPAPSVDDVMNYTDGNICRCTGYRSIVDAIQSFCVDAENPKPIDIEDLCNIKCVKKQIPQNASTGAGLMFKNWVRPRSLENLHKCMENAGEKRVRLVFGNTDTGVYKKDRYDVYIDIRDITELYKIQENDDFLELGANLTLTELKEVFGKYKLKPGFGYLKKMEEFISLIANTPVRNSASWAGNVMMQHKHREFLSDLLPPLEAIGTKISIGSKCGERVVGVQNLLDEDMKRSVILSLRLPALADNQIFSVYKVMPKHRGAHGYAVAAFMMTFADKNTSIVKDASVVFNGLHLNTNHHSVTTEECLRGKDIKNESVQKDCLMKLTDSIEVAEVGLSPVEYRKNLARNMLYKFLRQFGTNFKRHHLGNSLQRPRNSGSQDYETLPEKYPLTQPLTAVSAKLGAAGEVVFLDDLPTLPNELSALPVLSTIARGEIDVIDTSAAKALPGVVDVITAADLPGPNVVGPIQILANDAVEHNGQPLAVVVAEDLGLAYKAASMVRVTYKNQQNPVLDLDAASEQGFVLSEVEDFKLGDPETAMKNSTTVVEGTFYHGQQYHFFLENQCCLVVPRGDGLDVWSSTQHTAGVQAAVANALGMTASSVQVTVPRVGGAFGGKIQNPNHSTVLAAIGAARSNRPVRFVSSLETSIKMFGHRPSVKASYKVGVDENGLIQAVEVMLYWNGGHKKRSGARQCAVKFLKYCDGAYHFPNIMARGKLMKTNTPWTSAMRAPSPLPAHLFAEHLMEHVAHVLAVDPVIFKQKHLCSQGQMMIWGAPLPDNNLRTLWYEVMKSADVVNRQKQLLGYNEANRWVKRGLAVCPAKCLIVYKPTMTFTVYLAVYQHDGSVVVSHGGVEFGQGLDTKVTQVVMHTLGVPQDLIKCVQTNTLTAPNTTSTAASLPSELLCRTAQLCCETILKKLEPLRLKHPDADWKTLVQQAHQAGVHMAATEKYVSPTEVKLDYTTLGVCVAEAEVDILTGESQILRADIHMDIGESVNPALDIGQIEGALIIGLGLMLHEREIQHPESGELLTASTWDYKPPLTCDIPIDLRVSFLKGHPNTKGAYSSKAVGEPAIHTTPVFLHAVKAAITASRKERGKTEYFDLYAPATPDRVLQACDITQDDFH